MLDSWLASVAPGYGGVTSMAGAPSAPPPSGMLASLFSPSGLTQPGGTMDSMLSGAVPAVVPPGSFPAQPGATAMASVPPGPPLDLSPPLTPQASAAPAQGPDQPAVPQTSMLGRLGSLFGDKAGSALGGIGDSLNAHSNTLMALGAGMAGAPTLGMGLSRGLSAAIPAGQLDRQQGFQNATLNWLKAKGMPEDAAKAVVSNPALLAQIAPQMFGAKQLTATTLGTDVLGHPIPGMMNPVTGEHFDIYGRKLTPGGPAGGPGGGLAGTDPAKWAAMAPEERLSTFDPQIQGEIKAIYEGRQAATGRNVQQLLPLVNQVYPDFTMQDYKTKQDTQHSFTGQGKNALELKAANTAIYHADNLDKAGGLIDKLGNTGFFPGFINPAVQGAKSQLSPEFQATKGKYDAQVEGLAGELSKAFNGGNTAVADREHWRDVLSRAKSPAELHAAVGQAMEMLHGRLTATAESYNKGMGSMRDGISFLDPANQQIFQRLRGIETPAGAAAPAPGGAQSAPAQSAAAPVRVSSPEDARRLPSGTQIILPDGSPGRVP